MIDPITINTQNDLPEEIWKPIKGYEGLYCISSKGRIKKEDTFINNKYGGLSLYKSKIYVKKPTKNYRMVNLTKDGTLLVIGIHRLVALNFIPNPHNKPFINHKNGIKWDNRVENLEWCTQKENVHHAWDTGLSKTFKGAINNILNSGNEQRGEKHRLSLPVIEIDTGRIFSCMSEAAKYLGISDSAFERRIRRKVKATVNFKFLNQN